jgi:hypothetical protein
MLAAFIILVAAPVAVTGFVEGLDRFLEVVVKDPCDPSAG